MGYQYRAVCIGIGISMGIDIGIRLELNVYITTGYRYITIGI